MMMSKALCAAALALALVCSVAPAASADDTKCANWVCDTDYGFWAKNAVENAQGECECLPYYTSGPCEGMKCPEGWMAKAKEDAKDECECMDPCHGLHCDPPKVEVPDYGRTTESWCKCVAPPKGYEKDEL